LERTAPSAAKATTPTSAPGSEFGGAARHLGFTLIELLVVVALIAIASGMASLALRDPSASALENEAARLAALLESARAQSRASGVAVTWGPQAATETTEGKVPEGFRFTGNVEDLPSRWQNEGVSAQLSGNTRSIALGPEPLIGAQRIVLRLNDRIIVLATDGLGPFAVADNETP
jgi:general secretion pathway protein H